MVILRNAKNSNGAPEGAPQPPRIMAVTTTIRIVMVVSTTTLNAKILQQQTPQKDKILHSLFFP